MYKCKKIRYFASASIRRMRNLLWMGDVKIKQFFNEKSIKNNEMIAFDTSMESLNLGDEIIQHYCSIAFDEIGGSSKMKRVPTHVCPNEEEQQWISVSNKKIVCGTNLITPHFEEFSNWKMPLDLKGYNNIITMGVGWGYYCEKTSQISKFVYRTILSKKGLHSVRDSYTEKKFKEMGITNVVNTGCPTLWGLTKEHCQKINKKKSPRVITTLTDYDRDEKADKFMLDLLKEKYEDVFVWIQGTGDFEYLKTLVKLEDVKIIERDLNAYTTVLQNGNVDYVGTRLHAGIHALNNFVRTIIIAVDNRAKEMGKDFRLPVINRENIYNSLENMVDEEFVTEIDLPVEEIKVWKTQFDDGGKNGYS